MKKIIIAVALMLTTGVLSSQTKLDSTQTQHILLSKSPLSNDSKELASGD